MSKVSKVIYGDTTVIDITDSTVNANNLLSGNKAYGADGEPVIGALSVGSTVNVTTTDSELFGETLTLSDGTTTLTTTFDNSGDATFESVLLTGNLTLACQGNTMFITILTYDTYNIVFATIPEGATVTPTDDIQTWLKCANITDKAYTTLVEVLADEETYEILLRDSNACDYMARSTTWASTLVADETAMRYLGKYDYACDKLLSNQTWANAIANSSYFEYVLNVKVPVMTSNTTPSGVASASYEYNTSFSAWKAFDGLTNTAWSAHGQNPPSWIRYTFPSAEKIYIAKITPNYSGSEAHIKEFEIWGSNDSFSTHDVLKSDTIPTTSSLTTYTYVLENPSSYTGYEIYGKNRYGSGAISIYEIQFYGRASKEVLVPLVPTMTSNTTPSGIVIANGSYQSDSEHAYCSFDGNDSTFSSVLPAVGNYIGYLFTEAKKVGMITCKAFATATWVIQGKVSDSWVDIRTETVINGQSYSYDISSDTEYEGIRFYVSSSQAVTSMGLYEAQFYAKTVQTNIVHSCANDTIYYIGEGSPVIVATTNSDGDGVLDFSSLNDGTYTFYSSVAKDPSNLSNDFSKAFRITKSQWGGTTELYLMPSTINILYWWGYEGEPITIEKNNSGGAVSKNTNNISIGHYTSTSGNVSDMRTTNMINLTGFNNVCILINFGNTTSSVQNLGYSATLSEFIVNATPTYRTAITPTTSITKKSLSIGANAGNNYVGYTTNCYPSITTIYALWLE